MKEYTFEQFIKDVKKEVVALRKHAKTEELKKLSIYMLDPMQPTLCIYGLMTGDCRNERAADLIFKCCKRFIINERYEPWNVGEESILMSVNGTKIPGSNKPSDIFEDRRKLTHLSSVESYIMLDGANLKGIIEYLKGETNRLEL